MSATQAKEYSSAVYLTGEIPLAQELVIGGFLNVPNDALGEGYVIRDESGHLRLLDYPLLRSGTLAYPVSLWAKLSMKSSFRPSIPQSRMAWLYLPMMYSRTSG